MAMIWVKGPLRVLRMNVMLRMNDRHAARLHRQALQGAALRDLVDDETSGHYGFLLKLLASPLPEAEAGILRKATKGLGTKEDLIYSVVVGRTNVEISILKKYDVYGEDLGSMLDSDLHGNFQTVILASLQVKAVLFCIVLCGGVSLFLLLNIVALYVLHFVDRGHSGAEKFEVGPTYTFDFHTTYVDLTRWETANLPGELNAMDLVSFFDSLPLRLVAYDVRSTTSENHRQRDKDYLFSFEAKYDKHRRHLHGDLEVTTTEEAVGDSSSGRALVVEPSTGRGDTAGGLPFTSTCVASARGLLYHQSSSPPIEIHGPAYKNLINEHFHYISNLSFNI
ncbi:hypothetical protein PR003_g4677 [Phytophthora rubi]|uniref:Domain of unknown function at the cortex 1 domain-containing protein n=1 Tax=Phytophthora rubi TaxID=129364 RepID=A0A6A4G1C7_9STRA|nr:hypothetical protein PR003_g4677 [Phytophthora rubi]